MTPTLAYLLGLVTLPGMVLGLGAAFYACDRVAGWWRGPTRRWSALARGAGAELARRGATLAEYRDLELDARVWVGGWSAGSAFGRDRSARRWARWAPWWPA